MFKRFHFIILLSNTFKKAAMALDTIKNELKDNENEIEEISKDAQREESAGRYEAAAFLYARASSEKPSSST